MGDMDYWLQDLRDRSREMDIEEGWVLHSADFSMKAAGTRDTGTVRLVRNVFWRNRWHDMPDELKDDDYGPDLYVHGSGRTLEEAIVNANLLAAHAKPIP